MPLAERPPKRGCGLHLPSQLTVHPRGADALNQRPAHGRKEHSEALGGTRVAKALLGSILGAPPWL